MINFKIIINSLLIIFVLHLLLQNNEKKIYLGNKKQENFENNLENNDSRSNLLKYLEEDDPKPSNSNLENNSIPNFGSDNQDLSKFFNTYDDLDEKELGKKLNENINHYSNGEQKDDPNTWVYKNEMPMNGGNMGVGGIVGFDSLDSNFASINFEDTVPKIDDLRNGMDPN